MAVKQRRGYANYLNVSKTGTAQYVLCGMGFTELNEAPSAQVMSKRYINDKNATKTIVGYEWSSAFNADMVMEEAAVNFIREIGEHQLIGSDAETDYIIVDLDSPEEESNVFKARKFKIAIEVSNFDNNDGEMGVSGNFLGIGDIVHGTFTTTTKTFSEVALLSNFTISNREAIPGLVEE